MISPKSSSRKVAMTDSKRKRMPAEPNVKSRLMMRAARMTMQMFTRLLTTRIVASS